MVDRIRFGAFGVPVAFAAWHDPQDAMKSGRPRFTLAGSGTAVHAHHQRAFGATSRAAVPSAPRPCPLPCVGATTTANHPQSTTATARVIEFLLDEGPV